MKQQLSPEEEEEEEEEEAAAKKVAGGKEAAGAEEAGGSPSKRTRNATNATKRGGGGSEKDKEDHADLAKRYPVGTQVWVFCRKTDDDEAVDPPLAEKDYFTASGSLKSEVPLLAGEVAACDLSESVEHWEERNTLELPPSFLALEVCQLFPCTL